MQDSRTLTVTRRRFSGLGATTAQSLFSQDQTLKAQIQSALAGNPVPGNPFPNATPQQLALALAGSTPWKPWNQSGTIEKAIANTVAMFGSTQGSDQILRSLQIAAGAPVTVGQNSPGVKVASDPASTAFQKAGLAALLNTTVPPVAPSSNQAPAPNIVQPVVQQQNPQGLVPQLQPAGTAVSTGRTTPADGTPGTFADGTPGVWSGGVLSAVTSSSPQGISAVLAGLPANTTSAGLQSLATTLAAGTSPAAPATSPGILDMLSAPIVLPLVGPVPTWSLLAAAAAAWWATRKKRADA